MPSRRVALLTGGGDCPGLNAVIRAIVLALGDAVEVLGFERGFWGLLARRWQLLDAAAVRGLLDEGGTVLGSHNRANPFDWEGRDAAPEAAALLRELGVETLFAIGGDGTLTLAERFAREHGVALIGVPKTIDNDIVGNERSFGFDSAVAVVADALGRLKTTARSHGRVMVLETMGRDSGWIALEGGLAGGADAILIPELGLDFDALCRALNARLWQQGHALVCVAEGVGENIGAQLVRRLGGALPGVEVRGTLLGHLQRGGAPTAFDRVLSTRFGVAAAQCWQDGVSGVTVALQGDRCVRLPLAAVAGQRRRVDSDAELLAVARLLGVIAA